MGVVSTHTMVTGTYSGFIGYFVNQAGTMSPATTDSIGSSPTISFVSHIFGFTTIELLGHWDNSSITGMTLTPSGGSAFTITFENYVYLSSSNLTRFSKGAGSNLTNNTTYTVQLLGSTTDMNTEGTTLERRNPKDMNDFYGATRNVPPVSGLFKLSWLKNAVKYQWNSSLTAGQASVAPPASYTIRGYNGVFPVIGSMTQTTPSGILGPYNGIGIQQLADYFNQPGGSLPNYYALTLTFFTTQANPGVNSQWYKLQIGSAVFYREDATFAANPNSPYWTTFSWNNGSTQTIANNTTYAIKLTC